MGQLRQRQQQREQHLLLDLREHCKGLLECWRGIWHKGVQLYEPQQSDQENLGSTSSQCPQGWTEVFQSSFMAALGFPTWGSVSLFMVIKRKKAQLDSRETQMEFDTISVTKRSCITHEKKFFKSLWNSKKERLPGLNMLYFFQQETWEKQIPPHKEPSQSWWQVSVEEHFPP